LRVIGRYWKEGENPKTKLFSNSFNGQKADTIEIKVVKPDKLGNEPYKITGPTKQDNVDKEYDIDEIVINISGKLGILPQVVRALISKESASYPLSYRYEPFYDMTSIQTKEEFDENHRYWIKSETDLGDPTIPKHNNLRDVLGPLDNYPGYISVWDFYNDKKSMYSFNIPAYGKQKDKLKVYHDEHEKFLTDSTAFSEQEIDDSSKSFANIRYIKYLKEEMGEIGMAGTPAQTRISASYGMMQLTYYGATNAFSDSWNVEYQNNNFDYLPEYLMLPDINIEYATKHFLGKLRNALGTIVYPNEDTWSKTYALETSYWEALLGYNGGTDENYPNNVYSLVIDYLPKKN